MNFNILTIYCIKNIIFDMDIKEKINKLSEEVLKHQYLYYVKSMPEISDREYDKLFDELIRLEKKYPQFAWKNSPTKRVGSDIDNDFPVIKHSIPVLSLDKEYSINGIREWVSKTIKNYGKELSFVVEEKLDGASIVIYYKNGEFDYALTRGNGFEGNDVSNNVKTIAQVPLVLNKKVNLAVRGEIYIEKKDFIKYNKEFDNKYSNPRNLAAGSLRNIKSNFVSNIPLKIFVYEGYFENREFKSHVEILKELEDLGFRINKNFGFFSNSDDSLNYFKTLFSDVFNGGLKELDEFFNEKIKIRNELDYDIDGLVVKVNELNARNALGFTSHHPRWAIAFKFESPVAQTRLIDIKIQVGRNGRITPVAILEPIKLAGSVVSRATLHNQEYIEILELGIGDIVSISKRGDIIPAVEEVIEKDKKNPSVFKFPENCPFCNTKLKKIGGHHFCTNRDCKERIKRSIIYFTSKDRMDIETLGEKTIELLFDKGYISSIPDIYTFNYDKLLNEEGFKEKKVEKIKKSVEKSKEKPFSKVLVSLGFEGLGEKAVNDLIKSGLNSMDKILDVVKKKDFDALTSIEGFGMITAELVIKNFTDEKNLELIRRLRELGLNFEEKIDKEEFVNKNFLNQVWVITGSFENFKPRSKAGIEIEKRGGKVVSSVSSNTTHILVGKSPGSKLERAKSLGVEVVYEDEFIKLLEK